MLKSFGNASVNGNPAINNGDGTGALWINRLVRVYPRFQIFLNVAINNGGCLNFFAWAYDGFTIILANTNNNLGGGGGFLGAYPINNAIVTEFDFYQNSDYGDQSSNAVSIHKCPSSACSVHENGTTQSSTNVPAYYRCSNMVYNIHLRYNSGTLSIFINNNLIVQTSQDLDKDFGSYSYVGFTGFNRGNWRNVNIGSSYICEDTYSPQNFLYYWTQGTTGANQSSITVPAGSNFSFTFAFRDSEYNIMHHFYGTNSFTNGINFTPNCGSLTSPTFNVINQDYLQLIIAGCTIPGNYALTNNVGSAPFPYTVIPASFRYLNILGYNGVNYNSNSYIRTDSAGNSWLNFGSLGGNFTVDDFGGSISLDFFTTDQYFNPMSLGTDPSIAQSQMGISINNNGNIISFSTSVVSSGKYRITFSITNLGTYIIASSNINSYLNRFFMSVIAGKPSFSTTSCTLMNYSYSPILDGNTNAMYDCVFRDSKNNILAPTFLNQTYGIVPTCTLTRKNVLNSLSNIPTTTFTTLNNHLICYALPTLDGSYNFTVNVGSLFIASSIIGQFTVLPAFPSLSTARVFDYSNNNFTYFNKNQANITYVLGSNLLTMLDFVDGDGTFFSQFGYNPNFSPSVITGIIIDTHNPSYNSTVRLNYTIVNNLYYVGVYLDNASTFMLRNSFQYQLSLLLYSLNVKIFINYPMVSTYNNLNVCTHSLSPQNTQWIPTTLNPVPLLANTLANLGLFVLRTQDNNLYNYKSAVTASVSPNITGTSLIINPISNYDGVYNLTLQATTATNYNVTVTLNNTNILSNYTVSYLPIPVSYNLNLSAINPFVSINPSPNIYNISTPFTADSPVQIYLNSYDIYSNLINITPTISNNYLGIKISLAIQGVNQNVNMNNNTVNLSFDPIQNSLFVTDYYVTAGNHTLTITSTASSNSILISYQVLPGKPNPSISYGILTSSNTLTVNQYATISVLLIDSQGNNLANQASLTNVIPNIIVKLLASDNSSSILSFVDISQMLFRFTTNQLPNVLNYNISVSFNNTNSNSITTIPCATCSFAVVYDTFDITKCQLSAILSSNVILSKNSPLQINNQIQNPLFNFNFFNSKGQPLQYVNPNSNIIAVFSGANLQFNFFSQFVSNQILWTFPTNINVPDIVGGNYNITIQYNNVSSLIYPVQLTGDGQDSDAGNGSPNLNLTYFYSNLLNTVAGNGVSFNIEFRTNQNLRVNRLGDLTKFSFSNSKNYTSPAFNVNVLNGAKKGQYIITVNSIIASYSNNPIVLSLSYNNSVISQVVSLVVNSATLNNIIINSSSILQNSINQLQNGTTVIPYAISMSAYDKYNNIFQDVFNSTIYPPNKIAALFNIQYQNNSPITVTASANATTQTISLLVITQQTGTINLNSFFLSQSWQWIVNAGPLSSKYTFGLVTNQAGLVVAGNNATFEIFPRDVYNNIIPLAQLTTSDYNLLGLNITQPNNQNNLSPVYNVLNPIDGSILFTVPLYQFGYNYFTPTLTTGQALSCTACQLQVNLASINFAYSVLINGNTTMTQTNPNNLIGGVYPTFSLYLNDNYNNTYNYIPSNFNYSVLFQGNNAIVAFCSAIQNNFINIFVCKDQSNLKSWINLVSSPNYYLKITYNNYALNFPIKLSGSTDDTDASNAALFVNNTYFNTNNVTAIAGQVAQFMIELRGNDNKRNNYWFDDPSSNITISFTNSNSIYTNSVSLGPKPGQYFISVSSQKTFLSASSNNYIYLTINGTICPTQVIFGVTPAAASSAFIVDSNNINIPYGSLASGSADNAYVQKLVFYDIYQNIANVTVGNVNLKITPPSNKQNVQITSNIVLNPDNSIIITVNSIFAGTYTLSSNYFIKPYTFNVNPGKYFAQNSLAVVPTSAVAGNNINLYIIPFDANNNYIDPSTRTNIFNVTYNYKDPNTLSYIPYIPINTFQVGPYPNSDISSCSNCNAYVYTVQTNYRDQNNFVFTLNNTSAVTCINCVTNVLPGQLAFNNSLLMRYNSASGAFNKLTNNVQEDNSKLDIKYRLYPRDSFSNSINSMPSPLNYTLVLTDMSGVNYYLYNNVFNTTTQQYIEFIKNDNSSVNGDLAYNTLVTGNYSATISNGIQNIIAYISLIGRPSDLDASNQKINVQNTVITAMNLAFIAGQSGFFIIELKNIDNMRKNNWNHQVSVSYLIVDNENMTTSLRDNSFVSSVSQAGNLGLFYISVSSSLARTSLKTNRLILQITVDSILVANLQPELIISPGQMASAQFVNSYVKSDNTLVDGNADNAYVFQTIGYDIYNNPTDCNGNLLQLNIIDPNKNRVNFNVTQVGSPSIAIFSVDNKISGIYTINSSPKLLPQATFYNSFGSLNNLQSLKNNLSINLIAGSVASFSITPKDQYFNNIPPNLVLTLISVTVTTPSGKNLSTNVNISNEQIIYSLTLTEQGINSWQVTINNQAANCMNCITTVSPSDAVPANSVVTYFDDNGVYTVLSNNYQITRSNQNPISVSVAFVDAYGNLIKTVPSNVSIQSSVIQGNYMTPMNLIVAISSDSSALITSVDDSQQSAFKCLVSGSYSFSFTILSGTQSYQFLMPLKLTSLTNDSGYGNGIYVVEQTQLSNTSINMIAGTISTINIKLRTAQMLYYHSDISPSNDISFSLSSTDPSFTFTPYKRSTNFGDYNIDIYTSLSTLTNSILKVLIRDPNNPNNFKEIPIQISLSVKPSSPPDNTQTNIVLQPGSTTLANQNIILQFQLFDKYGNVYVRNTDLINNNLVVYQNNNQVTNAVITLLTDSITYQLSYLPTYPPRSCTISILYNDSQSQTNLFLTPISTQIISSPFYPNTLVSGPNVNRMKAGEKLSISVQFLDNNNVCIDDTNINVVAQVTGPAEAKVISKKINYAYSFNATVSNSTGSNCGTSYLINVPDNQVYSTIGTYNLIVQVGPNNYLAQTYNQQIVPNVLDPTKFVSTYQMTGNFNPGAIIAGSPILFTITGNDKFGNQVTSSISNLATIKLTTKDGQILISDQDNSVNYDYKLQILENHVGVLSISVTIFKANNYIVQYYYQDSLINSVDNTQGPFYFTIIPNVCSTAYPNVDLSNLALASSGISTYFMISCADQYNNTVTIGGDSFVVSNTLNIMSSMTSSQVNSKITDNLNGSYRVDFTPPLAGSYVIILYLRGKVYGNKQTVSIKDTICTSDMPIRCANNLAKCVKNAADCLASNNNPCAMPSPFSCLVNNVMTCVSSNTDCDCPSGYVKCSVMNVCVPANKNYMCSFSLPINCSKRFPKSPKLCPDGICRSNINNSPSQRVCPLGSVLCADLTCRSTYSQCAVYNDCAGNMIRCSDQSCVLDQKDCPSSITCSDRSMYVCPDSRCVSNEIYCKPLQQCSNTNPILCANNSCLASISSCPKQVSCGQEKSLCQDMNCKSSC